MKKIKSASPAGGNPKRQTEPLPRNKPPSPDPFPSRAEALTLVHELQVHQIELERQNEALRLEQETLQKQAERLRKLAWELTCTEQCERHQMALVLHDQIQQCLVGARMHLEALRQVMVPKKRQQISQAIEAIRESFESCRSLTAELCPLVLYNAGLSNAIQNLADWMHQNHGLVVQVTSNDQCRLADHTASLVLYEAVRELLLNVIQHAGVKEAELRLSVMRDDQIQIIVTDQGRGFDPAQLHEGPGRSSGSLFKVSEQLGLLGGRLEIQSAPGKGSQCTLWVARGLIRFSV